MSENWTPTYIKVRQLAWEHSIVIDEDLRSDAAGISPCRSDADALPDQEFLDLVAKLHAANRISMAEMQGLLGDRIRELQEIGSSTINSNTINSADTIGADLPKADTALSDFRITEALREIETSIEGVRKLLTEDTTSSDQQYWDALSCACRAADGARMYLDMREHR